MSQCDKCSKNITKTKPGLECGKCGKMVHFNECSGLTSKQRAALRANDSLEWTCEECQEVSPKRRSVFIPEDEDQEEGSKLDFMPSRHNSSIDIKKLLRDISIEVEKSIKHELKDITKSFEFHTDKMDEILDNIEAFKTTVQDLKKKNTELANKNNNLEIRVGALEQRIQDLEQKQLAKTIEISNIPNNFEGDCNIMLKNISAHLKVPYNEIDEVKHLSGRKDRPGMLMVKFRIESDKRTWLENAKTTKISIGDIVSNSSGNVAKEPIYIREALTPYNKKLLWTAKQELKDKYKFVWCKNGIIRARKDEKVEAIIIRSEEDIKKNK